MRYIPFSSDLAQCSIFHNLLAYSKLLSPKNSIVTKNKAKNRASPDKIFTILCWFFSLLSRPRNRMEILGIDL